MFVIFYSDTISPSTPPQSCLGKTLEKLPVDMASINPPIVDYLTQSSLSTFASVLGQSGIPGEREVLLAWRKGMHLDVRDDRKLKHMRVSHILLVLGVALLEHGTVS